MPFSTIRPFVPYRRYESRLASLAPGNRQHVAEKDRTVGSGQFAVANAIENLPVAVALTADRDGPLGKAPAIGSDPNRLRAVAFPHDAGKWNRRRTHRRAGADDEMREHPGSQLVLRVVDLGSHQHAAGIWIHNRPNRRDLAVETAAGKRADLNLYLLADTESRTVSFRHISEHPHRVDVCHSIGSRRVARLHEQSRRRIACRDPPVDWTGHDKGRVRASLGDDTIDVSIVLTENAHCVARGAQVAFGGLLV